MSCLKNNIKIYIKIYIKTAPTYFGVTVTPSSGSALIKFNTRQIPNSDPKFHQPLIFDGVGKSTRASFAILNKGCLFHVGFLIGLCVVVTP